MSHNRRAIFIRMASRPVPRVQRGMKVAAEQNFTPEFCGAFREDGLLAADSWGGFPLTRVGRPFPLLNGKRAILYVISVLAFNFAVFSFLRSRKPILVHASDVETMPAAIIYCKIFRIKLIYNIHDNVAQRYNLPQIFNSVLNMIEGLMVLMADSSLVPEPFRRDALPHWSHSKIVVVRNTPVDAGYFPPPPLKDGRFVVFYGGWLDWGRGLKEMIMLAEAMPEMELRVAGEGSDEIVEYVSNHSRVTFLGFLEYADSLAETRNAHFVVAFYKPITVINRYAASNKIAESLSIGRPLILNSEIKIAELFAGLTAAIISEFGDIDSVAVKLHAMLSNESEYIRACLEARELYEKYYSWSVALDSYQRLYQA